MYVPMGRAWSASLCARVVSFYSTAVTREDIVHLTTENRVVEAHSLCTWYFIPGRSFIMYQIIRAHIFPSYKYIRT